MDRSLALTAMCRGFFKGDHERRTVMKMKGCDGKEVYIKELRRHDALPKFDYRYREK